MSPNEAWVWLVEREHGSQHRVPKSLSSENISSDISRQNNSAAHRNPKHSPAKSKSKGHPFPLIWRRNGAHRQTGTRPSSRFENVCVSYLCFEYGRLSTISSPILGSRRLAHLSGSHASSDRMDQVRHLFVCFFSVNRFGA